MLQNWGGSKQQAYYSIANHIAAVSLLATTSILRILWKEISEAKQKGDIQRIKFLYKKATRMLYFFGAILADFGPKLGPDAKKRRNMRVPKKEQKMSSQKNRKKTALIQHKPT